MRSSKGQFETLVDLLQHRVACQPNQRCFTFLENGTIEVEILTYRELDLRARAVAASLQDRIEPGNRVLLLYPPGLDFITAFFGCLYAGIVTVPASPPKPNQKFSRLNGIIENAQPALILSPLSLVASVERMTTIMCLATDRIPEDLAAGWEKPRVESDSLALLQYTSGSTSMPKGVMVTHRNLLQNSECINRAFELTEESRSVSWLPSYHDMGLVDGIIQPIYGGFAGFLMAPASFLQSPILWLQAISYYRATHSGGPNFAFDLCVSKTTMAQREALDLSCWIGAYNGAEPVRAGTLRRFCDVFKTSGFRPQFFFPCYGLAEATLMVTGGLLVDQPTEYKVQPTQFEQHRIVEATLSDEKTITLIGSGRVNLDTRVIIVDPDSLTQCDSDQVGEIWVSGVSVATGYWREPELTEKTFQARLKQNMGGPFLRTGDLGFIRGDELFVTGRLKDMFIVRGRNHYPQDIELTAELSHPAFRAGCGAAFTVELDDNQQLVFIQEVERKYLSHLNVEEIATSLRRTIAQDHDLHISTVVLLRPGTIPKTSSGKIQRNQCRTAFLTRTLVEVGSSTSPLQDCSSHIEIPNREQLAWLSPLEQRECLVDYLHQVASQVLRASDKWWGPEEGFSAVGLDSLGAMELKYRVEKDLDIVVPMVAFLRDASIREVADEILGLLGTKPPESVIRASPNEIEYPLSRGQNALWFLERSAPNDTIFNISFAVRILSDVDTGALRQAFEILTDRHLSLRTTVGKSGEQVVQRIQPKPELDFDIIDATMWTSETIKKYLEDSCCQPFDFENGPLFRVRLCQQGPSNYILLMMAHHIVMDFRSLVLLLSDFSLVYPAVKARREIRLPRIDGMPADFVRWQTNLVTSASGENQWNYWRSQLIGAQSMLNLPTDRPRPQTRTFEGAVYISRWSRELTNQLRVTAQSQGVTVYVLLLAGLYALLYRYTGQEDISVGSTFDGRSRADFSQTIGYLVNQVVLRANLSGNPSFREFLAHIRQVVFGALANRDFPFQLLVERLKPERDAHSTPMFQVMFILQKPHELPKLAHVVAGVSDDFVDLGGLCLQPIHLERRTAQFDLTLTVVEAEDEFIACWEYNRGLFDSATIQRMDGHLQTLQAAVFHNIDQSLSLLPLLNTQEREQILSEWNQTRSPYPENQCFHQLFEDQALRTPSAVAVTCEDRSLTYKELDRRSNQVAHELAQRGVGPEVFVGICIKRSIEMVVALLGVLKAGGAYLPLDPSQPETRIEHILREANICILLTEQCTASRLSNCEFPIICLDTHWETIEQHDTEKLRTSVNPNNLAYVIYTSGSTGTPKGAMITHRGLVNYLSWCVDAYKVDEGGGAPVNSSIGFDATITSIFAPLLVGKEILLMPEQREIAALAEALQSGRDFSIVKITPAHLQLLKSYLPFGHVGLGTRALIIGGERLSTATVEYWQIHAPNTRIINEYGPTETVVGCCSYDATTWRHGQGPIPIGRPIANTEIYVLDSNLQPVPVGISGELYVGGVGVARGYLSHPELNAKSFIPNPFTTDPQARLYRTGDLARYRASGTIEFLGRVDGQVKIRGFRVELGEIEAVLLQHALICKVVVTIFPDADNTHLIAYIVWHNNVDNRTINLHHFVSQKLPAHMVPSAFVSIEELPLTTNGKVDSRLLPKPSSLRPIMSQEFASPKTEIERLIASEWKEVLKLEEIGVHDNFFDLGGHSLLLAELHQRLRERVCRELSIIELFQFPTISSLARQLGDGLIDDKEVQAIHDRARKYKQAISDQVRTSGGKSHNMI
jgi:amino acid adenylation domain-containing protein